MAEGLAVAYATEILQCYYNGVNITAPSLLAIKLHVGAPGAAGTTNPATETTRKDLSAAMADAASGAITSNAAVTWTAVAGSEDYTHFTKWTSTTAGAFFDSGTITANPVTAGDTFTLAAGDLDTSFTVAS